MENKSNNVQNKIHICEECIGEAITLAPTRSWKEKQSRNPCIKKNDQQRIQFAFA